MRRAICGVVVAGILAVPGMAVAQEPVREPIFGICLRPFLGKVLNLPLVDIPDQPIPKEPLEFSLGGQYRDCKP